MNKSFKQWLRLIAAAAIIGLCAGLGLWIFQTNFRSAPIAEQTANRTSANAPNARNSSGEVETLDSLEQNRARLGDKLAEAALDLREERPDLAAQALREAEIIAQQYEADDRELAKRNLSFAGDIKRAASQIEAGKIETAAEIIGDLLDRLNLPMN